MTGTIEYNEHSLLGPYRFYLKRNEDETGISGVGRIADGVLFSDGTVAIRWRTENRSTAVYDSIDDVIKIHGHNGKTSVVCVDKAPTKAFSRGVMDAYQDKCEGALYSSVGGESPGVKPQEPKHPDYINTEECRDYMDGYLLKSASL